MTAIAQITVDGHDVARLRLFVPSRGPWYADVDFTESPDVSGSVTIEQGSTRLVGTVVARQGGTHALQRRVRIVAGAGGWGHIVGGGAYHNDLGVSARFMAQEAARLAGETLGDFSPTSATLAADYVRPRGPASRALEDAAGGAAWWVDFDGRTNVGTRSSSDVDAAAAEVLDYDPVARVATLGLDAIDAVSIGSRLSERLDEPQTVAEIEIEATPESMTARVWCGAGPGRLETALEALLDFERDVRLFGVYAYRVRARNGERLNLQTIESDLGLPDAIAIAMWPGVAGAYAEVAAGCDVLVQFVNGRRDRPVVTHFAAKGGNGFVPFTLTLDATSKIKLGANATLEAARRTDSVRVTIPPGTVVIAASGGTVNPDPIELEGTITSGSSLVAIGPALGFGS